ncbi:EamA family transporter [Candidatus Uhrbacteria bacterium]|nr:EamA family transporter [Candidatus Uhrbacteria bacterium]
MELWILLAVIGGIGSNIFNFLTRYALKDGDDAVTFAWFFELIRGTIFAVAVFADPPESITVSGAALLAVVGIIEIVCIYLYMKMHSYAHLSISAVIIRMRLIWIPILAFLLLREALQAHEYIGILILFSGLLITGAPHKLKSDKGVRYAYIFSFFAALLAVTMKMASAWFSPSMIIFAMSIPSILVLPFLVKHPRKKIRALANDRLVAKISVGLINAGSFYLYTVALHLGSVSVVQAIYQSMMIFSIAMGIILFQEREDIPRKLIGTAITLIGIGALTLFS